MNQYTYDGPVMEFDKCVIIRWRASTYATSEKKALSNLAYQYKTNYNRTPNTKVSLPGVLRLAQREEKYIGGV